MKRYLVLLTVLFLGWVGTAWAQQAPAYELTTTPTLVIDDGRAEVMGSVRFTVISPNISANTFATTISVTYANVPCDDTYASGVFPIAAVTSGVATYVGPQLVTNSTTSPEIGALAAISAITNTAGGCVVSITIAVDATADTNDYIELQGVRGRVGLSPGVTPGTTLTASATVSPSTSATIAVLNNVVGTSAKPLTFTSAGLGTNLICFYPITYSNITFVEGYDLAFVQYVAATNGLALPADHRPLFGAVNNSEVHFQITNLPSGITLTWPLRSNRTLLADGVHYSEMSLVSQSLLGDSAVYEFSTQTQDQSDITLEQYTIGFGGVCDEPLPPLPCVAPAAATVGAISISPTAGFGTGTIQIQMYPPLITNDATGAYAPPSINNPLVLPYVDSEAPRFNDPYQPSPGAPFISNGPCTTTLLYPWVAFLPSGWDTGIEIANTSADPSNLPVGNPNWMAITTPTAPSSGTCTLYGYNTANISAPVGPTTDIQYTTPSIPSGATWAGVISGLSPLNAAPFTGYVIGICNFLYGHGFGYLSYNQGMPNGISQGYVALIIPNPVTDTTRWANNPVPGAIFYSGEGLSQ